MPNVTQLSPELSRSVPALARAGVAASAPLVAASGASGRSHVRGALRAALAAASAGCVLTLM
jgi:hypothetical protein